MNSEDDDMTVNAETPTRTPTRAGPEADAKAATDTGATSDLQARYLAGVRAELADLPPNELTEMLDDVGAHLSDLAAELGPDADLTARLGTPAAYAAELRAAAGYPAAPVSRAPAGSSMAGLALAGLVAATVFVTAGVVGRSPGFLLLGLFALLLAVPVLTREDRRPGGGGPRRCRTAAGGPVRHRHRAGVGVGRPALATRPPVAVGRGAAQRRGGDPGLLRDRGGRFRVDP